MDSEFASEFYLEQSKREIRGCNDPEQLRQVALQMVDLLHGQRRVFKLMMGRDFPSLG